MRHAGVVRWYFDKMHGSLFTQFKVKRTMTPIVSICPIRKLSMTLMEDEYRIGMPCRRATWRTYLVWIFTCGCVRGGGCRRSLPLSHINQNQFDQMNIDPPVHTGFTFFPSCSCMAAGSTLQWIWRKRSQKYVQCAQMHLQYAFYISNPKCTMWEVVIFAFHKCAV